MQGSMLSLGAEMKMLGRAFQQPLKGGPSRNIFIYLLVGVLQIAVLELPAFDCLQQVLKPA